jgi:hypothetical protein
MAKVNLKDLEKCELSDEESKLVRAASAAASLRNMFELRRRINPHHDNTTVRIETANMNYELEGYFIEMLEILKIYPNLLLSPTKEVRDLVEMYIASAEKDFPIAGYSLDEKIEYLIDSYRESRLRYEEVYSK